MLDHDYRLAVLIQMMMPVIWANIGIPPSVWWNTFERFLLAVDDPARQKAWLPVRLLLVTKSASLIGRFGSSAFRLSTTAVSMSPAGSRFSSESAPGPFHHGIRGRGGTIFWSALPSDLTAGPSGHTISPHPSSREGHHSTTRWSSSFLLSSLVLYGSHAAAASRVHRNSVPSTHMRCMITASRRASATIAFFNPAAPGDLSSPKP